VTRPRPARPGAMGADHDWVYPESRPALQASQAKEILMLAEIFGVDGVIVLIVVVVLLFGGAAIPKLARNLGSAKNEFEKGLEAGKKSSPSSNLAESNGTSAAAETPAPSPSPVTDDPTTRS
jgi:Sec-independent protein translocase protein TatA